MKTLIAEALRPFELTAHYINADYQPAFAFHTIDSNAGYDEAAAGGAQRGRLSGASGYLLPIMANKQAGGIFQTASGGDYADHPLSGCGFVLPHRR